ncbi:hypothetical protein HDU67_007722 [Dinochytrium kinnereticum]|nr:hypothetical protein HDU67_007722 [Dinochytrium kinnereticum]
MFSGVLQVTDLNDFLGPSQVMDDPHAPMITVVQACIKPPEVKKDAVNEDTTLKLEAGSGRYLEVSKDGEEKVLETATISLNDCLACSGCITSAESVLITSQSHHDLVKALKDKQIASQAEPPSPAKTIVVTLAPQSRASFAAKYNLTPLSVHRKLNTFFKKIGVDYFFDASFGRDFSLLESAKEFVERFKRKRGSDEPSTDLPVLASACPGSSSFDMSNLSHVLTFPLGWICYAEKTHPYLLPYISAVKSPQQIMGYLVKQHFANKLNLNPDDIFHVTVMPCYDKKLEASRNDFYNDVYRTRDVDSVITTGELERMFGEFKMSIDDLEESELPEMFTKRHRNDNGEVLLAGTEGSTSGGYSSFIFRYAAKQLFGIDLSPEDVTNQAKGVSLQPGKNLDYSEIVLQKNGEDVLRFATANGFRNIQNLVRKIKPIDAKSARSAPKGRKSTATVCHFVEVMACPSGCINGGGQLKTEGAADKDGVAVASKELTQRSERLYKSVGDGGGGILQQPQENVAVMNLYSELGPECHEGFRTLYHGVEKDSSSSFISGSCLMQGKGSAQGEPNHIPRSEAHSPTPSSSSAFASSDAGSKLSWNIESDALATGRKGQVEETDDFNRTARWREEVSQPQTSSRVYGGAQSNHQPTTPSIWLHPPSRNSTNKPKSTGKAVEPMASSVSHEKGDIQTSASPDPQKGRENSGGPNKSLGHVGGMPNAKVTTGSGNKPGLTALKSMSRDKTPERNSTENGSSHGLLKREFNQSPSRGSPSETSFNPHTISRGESPSPVPRDCLKKDVDENANLRDPKVSHVRHEDPASAMKSSSPSHVRGITQDDSPTMTSQRESLTEPPFSVNPLYQGDQLQKKSDTSITYGGDPLEPNPLQTPKPPLAPHPTQPGSATLRQNLRASGQKRLEHGDGVPSPSPPRQSTPHRMAEKIRPSSSPRLKDNEHRTTSSNVDNGPRRDQKQTLNSHDPPSSFPVHTLTDPTTTSAKPILMNFPYASKIEPQASLERVQCYETRADANAGHIASTPHPTNLLQDYSAPVAPSSPSARRPSNLNQSESKPTYLKNNLSNQTQQALSQAISISDSHGISPSPTLEKVSHIQPQEKHQEITHGSLHSKDMHTGHQPSNHLPHPNDKKAQPLAVSRTRNSNPDSRVGNTPKHSKQASFPTSNQQTLKGPDTPHYTHQDAAKHKDTCSATTDSKQTPPRPPQSKEAKSSVKASDQEQAQRLSERHSKPNGTEKPVQAGDKFEADYSSKVPSKVITKGGLGNFNTFDSPGKLKAKKAQEKDTPNSEIREEAKENGSKTTSNQSKSKEESSQISDMTENKLINSLPDIIEGARSLGEPSHAISEFQLFSEEEDVSAAYSEYDDEDFEVIEADIKDVQPEMEDHYSASYDSFDEFDERRDKFHENDTPKAWHNFDGRYTHSDDESSTSFSLSFAVKGQSDAGQRSGNSPHSGQSYEETALSEENDYADDFFATFKGPSLKEYGVNHNGEEKERRPPWRPNSLILKNGFDQPPITYTCQERALRIKSYVVPMIHAQDESCMIQAQLMIQKKEVVVSRVGIILFSDVKLNMLAIFTDKIPIFKQRGQEEPEEP